MPLLSESAVNPLLHLDHLERGAGGAGHPLDAPEREIPAGPQRGAELPEDALLEAGLEVDENVAAEDEIEGARRGLDEKALDAEARAAPERPGRGADSLPRASDEAPSLDLDG